MVIMLELGKLFLLLSWKWWRAFSREDDVCGELRERGELCEL
jgi:hypothetical protein